MKDRTAHDLAWLGLRMKKTADAPAVFLGDGLSQVKSAHSNRSEQLDLVTNPPVHGLFLLSEFQGSMNDIIVAHDQISLDPDFGFPGVTAPKLGKLQDIVVAKT